jgi:hypothetical protein
MKIPDYMLQEMQDWLVSPIDQSKIVCTDPNVPQFAYKANQYQWVYCEPDRDHLEDVRRYDKSHLKYVASTFGGYDEWMSNSKETRIQLYCEMAFEIELFS